ncbi:MAG: hypothetical protein KKF30_01860 [Proteobacteria bacterium]|nr:hypothetical protein [Pseudomonadota bacterium]MBU4471490.1 hypothetical protein [Pseudomonadota bacterium]MCG2752496.1 ATP-binding protein [Desulfobacteraceae bacterium]
MDKETALLGFIDKMEQMVQFQDKIDISSTINQIWKGFSAEIQNHIMVDVCALILVDEETNEFKLKISEPEDKEFICQKEVEYQIECGMFSWIIHRRKPAIIPSFVFKNRKSILMLPLSTVKRTHGAVLVLTPLQESAVTQENLRLLGMLAKQCSLVMENSILYHNVRKEHLALQEAQAQILQAEKMASIGRLTAGASHEILNPLSVISGHIQLMLMDNNMCNNIGKPLNIIQSQTNRISNIVNGMGQFAGYMNLKKTRTDLSELIDEFIASVKNELNEHHVEISADYPLGLPPIMGEKQSLIKVFQSLVSNSIDAMPQGGKISIHVTIENGNIRIKRTGNYIKIHFKDTGIGIPAKNLPRIYDPFFTSKDKACRTGLGLSLAYGVIDNHTGVIQAESVEKQGTTIFIYLPI